MKRNPSYYQNFCHAVQNNDLVILFGTGISSTLTGQAYSWWKWIVDGIEGLADKSSAQLLREKLEADSSTANMVSVVGKVMEAAKSDGSYTSWMHNSLEVNPIQNSAVASSLKKLVLSQVVFATTNYDNLLESATGLSSLSYEDPNIAFQMLDKHLVNNLYCKDLSKKVRSGVETKWKSGKSTSGRPPFGYLCDPDNKGMWIIDPAAADTVRRIFEMAAAGDGYQYILSTLNGEHVLTPGQYREKHGHVKRVNRKVSDDEWFWTYENIWKILKTYEYTGALVQKKNSRIKVGSNTSRRVPDDERIVVEGHHDPIVDKDTYYKARSLIREHKRGGVVGNDDFPLREVLYCGNCGLRMYKPRSLEPYVICRHKNVVGKHSACNDSRYPLDKINMIVRRSLRDQLIRMEQLRDQMTETRNNMPDYKKELGKLKMQMQGLESDKTRLYELYAAGSLDKDTYIARRSDVKERLDELNQTIREITTPDESQRELLEEADHYLRLAEKLFSISEITDEMVSAFIERINLYDEEHIEIIFKFEDLLKRIVNAAASESESGKAGVSA